MNTKEIIVSSISDEKFGKIHEQWYRRRNHKGRIGALQIKNPLHAKDYTSLIDQFMNHPKSQRISVNKEGVWIKIPRSEWDDKTSRHIAEIAQKDRVKKGHLDLWIGEENYHHECLRLTFAETSEGIVGYEMLIPVKYASEVTWEGELPTNMPRFIGLWHRPERYRLLGSFQG